MKFDLKNERHLIFLISLLLLSYFTYELILSLETSLNYELKNLLHMIHAFTIPVIFYIYLRIFDKWLWKWKIWRALNIINFPNINGKYEGKFVSSYKDQNGNNTEGSVELNIKQTATDICIRGKFNQSESISIEAFFAFNDYKQSPCLYYFYKNKPGGNATPSMHAHEGSAVLYYDEKTADLTGEYYSGRDRNNYGELILNKKNE